MNFKKKNPGATAADYSNLDDKHRAKMTVDDDVFAFCREHLDASIVKYLDFNGGVEALGGFFFDVFQILPTCF